MVKPKYFGIKYYSLFLHINKAQQAQLTRGPS